MQAVSLQEAIKILQKAGSGFAKNKEFLALLESQGRFLAQEIVSQKALPSFDNAAMDGYAIRSEDMGKTAKIKASIFAGDCKEVELKSGECAKIMTGAKLPKNADIVVPFEVIEGGFNNQESITIPQGLKVGDNIRQAGEEIQLNKKILEIGDEIDENALALLASQGVSYVSAFRELRIGVFSGGNELKEPWELAEDYQIYNSNTTMILGILKSFGFKASYGGISKDNKEELLQVLNMPFDIIFTTGGASKGEADFMQEVLVQTGAEILISGVQIKPGKPIMVARLERKFIIALPGNPLAGAVLLRFLILPFLRNLAGANAHFPQALRVKNIESFKLKKRMDAMLGSLSVDGFLLTQKGKYTSGQILPLCQSNAIALLSEECIQIEAGEWIKVLPYSIIWGKVECDYIN